MLTTHCQTISSHHSLPQSEFSSLNLSTLSLFLITPVPAKLLFISELNLDNNLLTTLSGLDQFMNLQFLSLNFNFISEKSELFWVRNKFLVKELSFLGNQIENNVTGHWLKGQGFTGLLRVNQVSRIGYLSRSYSTHTQNESPRFMAGLSFSKPINSNNKINPTKMSPQQQNKVSLSQKNSQTKRHAYNLNPQQQSLMMNQTDPDITQRLSKGKQQFESTGDTRNRKISTNKYNQSSKQRNSFYSSPQFNNHSFQQYANQGQYNMSSTKRNNITEFRLYPVNEQSVNRANEGQISPGQLGYYHHTNTQMHQHKKVKPFDEVEERPNYQNYQKYRSDVYQLDQRGARMRTRSEQSDNYIIQREIPVYKEAIAIAFYYRNLLEKVFKGYNQLLHQNSQRNYHQQYAEGISHEDQQQDQSTGNLSNTHNNIAVQPEEQLVPTLKTQLDLKRYAWMKLQLFANHKKITHKYIQSLSTSK